MAQPGVARGKGEHVLAGRSSARAGFLDDHAQDFAVALGRNRQPMFEIPGREAAFIGVIAQLDLAALQCLPVGRAKDRQQHAATAAMRQLLPVDIERGRVRRGGPPFEHVEPPRVIGKMHADMVGHEIQNQAQAVLPQRRAQPLESGFAAKLGIELRVIDDVVAVARSLARLHEWRGIEMRDAERLQIRHDAGGGFEIEIGGELQAVRRDRDRRGHFAIRCASAPTMAERFHSTRCPRSGFPWLRPMVGRWPDPTNWRRG